MNFGFWGLSALATAVLVASCASHGESGSSVGTGSGSFGEGGGSSGPIGVGGTDPFPGGGGSTGIGAGGSGGGDFVCPSCVVVASLPHGSNPQQVAVDDEHVYWTTLSGLVMQSDKNGTHVEVLAAHEAKPTAIAAQGGFVYWGLQDGPAIRRAPVGGGAVVDLGPAGEVFSIAVNVDTLFFAGPQGLGALPIDGLPEGSDAITLAAPAALSIAVGPGGVYWADNGAHQVKKADFALSTVTTLASAAGEETRAVAIDATEVYFGLATPGHETGSIVSASNVDGASATVLASGQSVPSSIAVDADEIFWADDGDGTVRKTARDGGSAVTALTTPLGVLGSIAIDATDVYFTLPSADLVLKVAK